MSSCLEQQLQAELHHARRHRRGSDDAERRRCIEIVCRRIELRMVEQVKGLHTELQRAAFPHLCEFNESHVEIQLSGTLDRADCGIAVTSTSVQEG